MFLDELPKIFKITHCFYNGIYIFLFITVLGFDEISTKTLAKFNKNRLGIHNPNDILTNFGVDIDTSTTSKKISLKTNKEMVG